MCDPECGGEAAWLQSTQDPTERLICQASGSREGKWAAAIFMPTSAWGLWSHLRAGVWVLRIAASLRHLRILSPLGKTVQGSGEPVAVGSHKIHFSLLTPAMSLQPFPQPLPLPLQHRLHPEFCLLGLQPVFLCPAQDPVTNHYLGKGERECPQQREPIRKVVSAYLPASTLATTDEAIPPLLC